MHIQWSIHTHVEYTHSGIYTLSGIYTHGGIFLSYIKVMK